MALARAVAFYLPQYHPIPENDEWWGPGFTEWRSVGKARPLYRGHHQPNVPGTLGFYDLRLPDTRAAQAELAAAHGVEAFCYWHYWFGGRRLLERPFTEVLASGEPTLPFCIGWANENWTKAWVGDRSHILVEQTYPGADDDERHFYSLLPAFADPRYFTVDGRPFFFVHRPHRLPDGQAFTDRWRALASKEGIPEPYFVGEAQHGWEAKDHGFDAQTRTPLVHLDAVSSATRQARRLVRTVRRGPMVHRYTTVAHARRPRCRSPHPELPMVMPGWDNTPRFGTRGFVLAGSTPKRYAADLRSAVAAVADLPPDERIVLLKSWNEWAEGNYLEPDRRFGDGYLRATAEALGHRPP